MNALDLGALRIGLIADLTKGLSDLDKLKKTTESVQTTAQKNLSKVGNAFMGIGTAITGTAIAIGTASTKAGIEFESAFAGVEKTVDATDEQLAELREGIIDLSKEMPQSASEISGVAEAAGQLGIKTENVLDFTKTMVMMGDSTNMSSETAATSLARLANITQMPQTEFNRLGSVIVALGNNLATTESEITDMGLRLAGAGKQIGLTEAQTLGLAGALSSVGIEAEAGGSAMSKVMVDMQLAVETGGESLDNFAKVAGMTAEDFQKSFRDDAAGALISFITGLQNAEQHGTSAIKVLDDMGITEVRMRDALLRAAGAGDLFTEAISLGTKAWDENTALTAEAGKRYETTESKIKILKNQITALFLKIADVVLPIVKQVISFISDLVEKLSNMSKSQQEMIIKIGLVVAAIGPLLIIMGTLMKSLSALMAHPIVLTITLVVAAIATLVAAISAVPTEMEMMSEAIDKNTEATNAWFESMNGARANLGDFSGMVNEYGQNASDLTSIIDENTQKINDIYAEAYSRGDELRQSEIDKINEYVDNIAEAQNRLAELEKSKAEARISSLQWQLDNMNLTAEEEQGILNTLQEVRADYTKATQDIISNEIAALDQRLQNNQISQEEYNRLREQALQKNQEYANTEKAMSDKLTTDLLASQQERFNLNMNDYNNRVHQFNKIEEIGQYHGEKMAAINNNETLSWFEKQVRLQAAEREMLTDFANFAAGQEVTWTDYNFAVDRNISDATAAFFNWIANNKAQGRQLSEDSRQNARDILNAYASLPEDLRESGLDSLRGLAQGMADEFPGLKDAASMDMDQLIQAMNDALGVASPSWKMDSAGQNLMEGLKQGTNKKAPSLMDHIRNIGQSMIDGFKNLFQIKSPSRVFRGFGENIGAGLEEGLLSSTDAVMKAGDELSKAALDGLNANKLEMEAVAFAGDALADAYRTPDISGYINTHEGSKDASGSVIKNEQNNYFTARELTPYEQAQQARRLGKALFEGV